MFQLTPIEMLLFSVAVVVSLYLSYRGFKKVIQVIRRGQGDPPLSEIPRRLFNAVFQRGRDGVHEIKKLGGAIGQGMAEHGPQGVGVFQA